MTYPKIKCGRWRFCLSLSLSGSAQKHTFLSNPIGFYSTQFLGGKGVCVRTKAFCGDLILVYSRSPFSLAGMSFVAQQTLENAFSPLQTQSFLVNGAIRSVSCKNLKKVPTTMWQQRRNLARPTQQMTTFQVNP